MIVYKTGSIFDSACNILVNPINCMGVMGAGLAKQFKERYADNFIYVKRNVFNPGSVLINYSSKPYIANFATKFHWKNPSKIEWISCGLERLLSHIEFNENYGIHLSVAIPKIGCGLGSLNWQDVRAEIERILGDCEQLVEVYE